MQINLDRHKAGLKFNYSLCFDPPNFRYHLPLKSVGQKIELNFFDKNDARGRLCCSGAQCFGQYGQKILKRVGSTEHFHRIHLISVVDPDPVWIQTFLRGRIRNNCTCPDMTSLSRKSVPYVLQIFLQSDPIRR